MSIGRSRSLRRLDRGLDELAPGAQPLLGELDDQDRVLGSPGPWS